MSAAIFGLVGVVIGGLLNVVGLWVIEYRRDRRVAQVAARLLIPDLNQVRDALHGAVNGANWSYVAVPRTRWKQYEDELARVMKPNDWSLVAGVFLSLEIIENEASVLEGQGDLNEPIPDHERQQMDATYRLAGDALDLLHEYGNTPPPPPELGIR